MPTDWSWPKILPASVRLWSSTPSEYRQGIAVISVILKPLKISTKYVDNSVEKLEANEVGSLPGLGFLNLCLKFGQLFKLLICFSFSYSTANFSRGNMHPSNFNRFHSIVILPVNKSPRGRIYQGSGATSDIRFSPHGFPMDRRVHLPDGLASVQTCLKRC
jgi:hypothetical protein